MKWPKKPWLLLLLLLATPATASDTQTLELLQLPPIIQYQDFPQFQYEPVTVEWLGGPIVAVIDPEVVQVITEDGKYFKYTDVGGWTAPMNIIVYSRYEIGLRSDGVVVWRETK